MKFATTILFLILLFNSTFAQSNDDKSDSRIKIDSIIQFQIGYIIDSTTNELPNYEWDSTKHKGIHPSFSSLPPNPMTVIVLNGKTIKIEELNKYEWSEIDLVKVFEKNNKAAMALYGTNAKNGLIILRTKD